MYALQNCMRPKFYKELIRVCNLFIEKKGQIEPHELKFDFGVLDENDKSHVSLTVKNYNTIKGLSRQMYEIDQIYDIEGPFGFGMCMKGAGTYVAFTGGIGLLAIIDLVANMILKNLGLVEMYDPNS